MAFGLLFVLWVFVPLSHALLVPPAVEGFAEQTVSPRVSPAERLNIAQFYFDTELDKLYGRELEHLGGLCQGREDWLACRAKSVRPTSRLVALVYAAPSTASAVVGELHAVLKFHPSYDLGYALEFRPRSAKGRPVIWLENAGDWFYGIEVPGVRIKGDWLQLFGPPFPSDSWVNGSSPSFTALAGSIEGSLVSLPALRATFPDGARRVIAPGSYLIERIRGSQVTLRQEVPTDFPCDQEVKPPAAMPPSLRTTAASLFDSAGAPLFAETYSKGC